MTAITLTCPLDGLLLKTDLTIALFGDKDKDGSVHLHHPLKAVGVCPNGHAWNIEGDLIFERLGI